MRGDRRPRPRAALCKADAGVVNARNGRISGVFHNNTHPPAPSALAVVSGVWHSIHCVEASGLPKISDHADDRGPWLQSDRCGGH